MDQGVHIMKKATAAVLLAALCMMMVTGLTGCKKAPNDWYKDTLEYYKNGVNNGFTTTFRQLSVPADLKDKNNKIGYLLIDLDKDVTDELLIGLIDDGYITKFTNVIVAHSDLGAYCLLSAGSGSYISLCADNVLCTEDTILNRFSMGISYPLSFIPLSPSQPCRGCRLRSGRRGCRVLPHFRRL